MPDVSLRTALSSAISYWEPRRILYNSVLAAVVVLLYVLNLPGSKAALTLDTVELLVVLAVLANVAYCAAYPPDVLMQMSQYRETWLKRRWVLLSIGLLFAAIITNFMSRGLLEHSP